MQAMRNLKSRPLFVLDTICNDLVKHKGLWVMLCRVSNVDIETRDKSDQEAILYVFQQILSSLNLHIMFIQRKTPIDYFPNIARVKAGLLETSQPQVKEYGKTYIEYLETVSKGKLTTENIIAIKLDRSYEYGQAKSVFDGIKAQLQTAFKKIGMQFDQVEPVELTSKLSLPSFIKEEIDYAAFGSRFIRTYVVLDYPRNGYANWLGALINFSRPVEITQHLHPYPKEKMIRDLEVTIAKLQSNMELQAKAGYLVSSELIVKRDDTKELLDRLASGKDSIIQMSFYVTISGDSLDELEHASHQIESVFRQLGLKHRRARKQMDKAIRSIAPLCDDKLKQDAYMFDTRSLSTLVPFTRKDLYSGGILYGINEETSELISFDRWDMANPNMVVMGNPGYGKSMFAKVVEIARQMINGASVIVIDHNGEYGKICEIFGGQYLYLDDGEQPDWNRKLIVFAGNKIRSLREIWVHITTIENKRPTVLIIDEFHNILREAPMLILTVMQEIRKHYVAPTLITQNISEFLKSVEGKQILDLCSIKILLHQGDNDMEEVEKLFDLSKYERMYLKTCDPGHGYIFSDKFKSKFKVDYTAEEERVLSTNPKDVYGGGLQ